MNRIARETLGVIDIFVTGETIEHRLAKKPHEEMSSVLSASRLRYDLSAQLGQSKGVIQFTIREQTGVPGDFAAVEFQLQATVEIDPARVEFGLTHRGRHDRAPNIATRY